MEREKQSADAARLRLLYDLGRTFAAHIELAKRMAQQLNTNTNMMKRWHEASPALQTIEKAHARNVERRIILPPTADLRIR